MSDEKKSKGAIVEYKEDSKPIVLADNQSPSSLIAIAIKQGTPIETIEKLMDLQDRWDKKQAKIAFDNDMADLQGKLPVIQKNKEAKDGVKILYKYAPLDDIIAQTKKLIMNHGFSYAFKTLNTKDTVSVTCIVKHKLGHSEESVMETSLATRTSIMSSPQQTAATVTFNKRYAFCNAFGIMTGDEDKDDVLRLNGAEKKDTTNYIDKLKVALYKKGGKTLPEAIEIFNNITGLNIKVMPTKNINAKEMYDCLIGSPNFNS